MATLRDKVLLKARQQLGVRYWTMHCGPKDSASPGFGCAMFACWCLNQVLGTDYYGSCWNLWGDAINAPQYNQGGGEFEVVDDPQPGDVVIYFKPNVNIGYSTSASHAALYIGNGRVIGAYGYGTPGTDYYMAGGSVRETTVQYQSLGGAIRYIRCKRLKEDRKSPEVFELAETVKFKTGTNVRTSPSMKGKIVAKYKKGDTCNIEGVVFAEGYVWGRYKGASSKQDRYVFLGSHERVTVV